MAQMTGTRRQSLLAAAIVLAVAATAPIAGLAQDAGLDQQAREAAWSGRVGEGIALMDRHLAANPGDRAAHMDRARFLAWRGDYAGAIAALDALGGEDDATRALRARIHAWAGNRETSLALNAPLYQADPDDYDTAYTQALALRLGEWPHEALPPFAAVVAAKPDGADTDDLARSLRLPLFSSIGMPVSLYEDSDDIRIRSFGLDGSLRLDDRWTILGYAVDRAHSAPAAGPFAPVTGGSGVDETRIGVGVRQALSPSAAIEVVLGRSELDPGEGRTIGHAAWSHRVDDSFRYTLRAERDRLAASPRALSLGLMRNGYSVATEWRPTLRDSLRVQAGFDDLSDGNRRHGVEGDYRRAVHRSERVNFDLGAQADWFGYSSDPGNGYYSPDRYLRIAPLASAYIKLGDEVGLYLQTTVGMQRDETFDSWRRAADVGGELTVGIFSHWQLVARAGYSERLNQFGKYEGTSVGLELRYRFCEFRADRCPRPTSP
jgi:hypothetical protein